MTDLTHIETVESLSEHYDAVSADLLRIDGVTYLGEKNRLAPIIEHIHELKAQPDPALFKNTTEMLSLLEDYAYEKGQRFNDKLTQIPNRSAFEEQLKIALKRRGTPTIQEEAEQTLPDRRGSTYSVSKKNYDALVFLDLDRFKGLNDKYGHLAGDEGLRKFAEIITEIIREDDSSAYVSNKSRRARLGGDEFGIMLHTTENNEEEAQENFEKALLRIRKELAVRSFEHGGMNFPLVSSCGMRMIGENDTPETVMDKADKELYKHKTGLDENGRTKQLRYDYACEKLGEQGVTNLQTVEDKRAAEDLLKKIMEMGTALQAVLGEGDISLVISPETVDKESVLEAIELFKKAGIDIFANRNDVDLEEVLALI